ncbi:MAG: zf-HC2 domain-containing protein [Ktedonobacteraceae bacterium]|nr:zf-HC2 domain-containing protein [Ktedonobacteraceae bacterium]
MICEHVEDLLSAYLDDALAPEEYRTVSAHLAVCPRCNAVLADFRRYDALLSQLPRVSPDAALHERLFSSSLRSSSTLPFVQTPVRLRREVRVQRIMQMMIAATLLLTLGVGGFIALNLRREQVQAARQQGSITPPAALQQGPLPAGIRFVFLRDGALWSGSVEGAGQQIARLTPTTVTVAANWLVQPAGAGHIAGDQLAYIDVQQGKLHTIRSDGQSDTAIGQALLPSSLWQTDEGAAIATSLAWSNDGTMLTFLADPSAVGMPSLYIYSTSTKSVRMVFPALQGMILHPTWSPDNMRIAFEHVHDGQTSVIDYNVQNNQMLTMSTVEQPHDTILALHWSANTDTPAITWSVGTPTHIHSLWIRYVGGTGLASMLAVGDYAQAGYSSDYGQKGSWLLLTQSARQLLLVNLNAQARTLTMGTQINSFGWSPHASYVDYLDTAALHVLNMLNGADTLLTTHAVANPVSPVWSADGQRLFYSTGTQLFSTDIQAKTSQTLAIKAEEIRSPLLWTQIP